jgi:hypothetical protein
MSCNVEIHPRLWAVLVRNLKYDFLADLETIDLFCRAFGIPEDVVNRHMAKHLRGRR